MYNWGEIHQPEAVNSVGSIWLMISGERSRPDVVTDTALELQLWMMLSECPDPKSQTWQRDKTWLEKDLVVERNANSLDVGSKAHSAGNRASNKFIACLIDSLIFQKIEVAMR